MRGAYLQLGCAVFFNVASYLVYRSIADAVPRIWWPIFAVGLMLGAANTFLFARSIKAIPLSVAYPVFTGASFAVITARSGARFPRTPAADSPARHRPRDDGHRSGHEVTCGPRTSLPGSAPVASPSR